MKQIPIYSAEASVEGLAEAIRAQSSIVYASKIMPHGIDDALLNKALAQYAKASAFDIQDLYPTKSILVTTSWNRNDDIFPVVDTWTARHTPVNKPTNLDHEESQLVGHMTGTWVIDDDGNTIADDTLVDNLPNRFHLCNNAVIYTHWQDDDLKSRTAKLITEIEAGTKYVSMECFFCNFDYGVESSSGEFHIVARDKSTAFLTKHLRAYKGKGEYEGYKIGRVPRDFVFSGKGYVDVPANPESIIFSNAKTVDFSKASKENPFQKSVGVLLSYEGIVKAKALVNQENMESTITMADNTEVLAKQIEDLKASLKDAQAQINTLTEKNAKGEVAKLEATITDLNTKLEAAKKSSDEEKKAADKAKADLEASVAKLSEVEKAKAELEQTLNKAKAEKVRTDRTSTLVAGGVEKTEAEKKVDLFANLNDEQFKVVSDELVAAVAAKKEKPTDKTKAAEVALASAQPNGDTAPVVPTETSTAEADEVRKQISARLNTSNKKKK